MKFCTSCGILKEYVSFSKKKDSPDGHANACKSCRSVLKKAEYQANKEKIDAKTAGYRRQNHEKAKAAQRAAYYKNRERIAAEAKVRYAENRESILAYHADYRKNNTDKIAARNAAYKGARRKELCAKAKVYYENNRELVNAYTRRYRHKRYKEDTVFALANLVRRRVIAALVRVDGVKSQRTEEMLGCTVAFLKAYLEAQFTPGMSWQNRGEWHIDHIVPLASAKTEAEVLALGHYTNLQPLWAFDNLSKGAKMDWREARA